MFVPHRNHLTALPARALTTSCDRLLRRAHFASSFHRPPWPFSLDLWPSQDTSVPPWGTICLEGKSGGWFWWLASSVSNESCCAVRCITVSQLHPALESKSIEMMLLCHLRLFYDQLTPFFFSQEYGLYRYKLCGVYQELCSSMCPGRAMRGQNLAWREDIQISCRCWAITKSC